MIKVFHIICDPVVIYKPTVPKPIIVPEVKYTKTGKVRKAKAPRVPYETKPGAPSAPIGRFGINFGISTPIMTYSLRTDGHVLIYNPNRDEANWLPVRTTYYGVAKRLTHFNVNSESEIGKAIGHPDQNPRWVEDCYCDKTEPLCDSCRVEQGLWLKVITACRAWRKEWVIPKVGVPVAGQPTETIAQDIGQFITGED